MRISCRYDRALLVVMAAILTAASMARLVAQPAQNPFVGFWQLDLVKSAFNPGPVPEKRVTWFQTSGDSITQIREQDDGFGSTQQMKYTAKFDGKDYPVEGSALDTVSLKRISPNTFERTGKIRGQTTETATLTVSADRKTLTITVKADDGERQYDNTEVYERSSQPPPKR